MTVNHGLFQRHCDIYVEVKGVMTVEDAKKIIRFSDLGYDDENRDGVSKTAVLVVGNIPEGESMQDLMWNMQDVAYAGKPPYYYNFETVDGDYFAAYPGIDKHGTFTLFGDDCSYTWSMNEKAMERAYRMARRARFEHGETPGRRRFR